MGISEKSPAKWDSNAVVPLVLILPLLVALGTSQMPTELVNPKSSWSTSSLKVSPKSSAGNKNWKPEKISKTKSPTPVFQPNTKKKNPKIPKNTKNTKNAKKQEIPEIPEIPEK